jgi:hypothetical protein
VGLASVVLTLASMAPLITRVASSPRSDGSRSALGGIAPAADVARPGGGQRLMWPARAAARTVDIYPPDRAGFRSTISRGRRETLPHLVRERTSPSWLSACQPGALGWPG